MVIAINKNKIKSLKCGLGYTLIELMVVLSIIGVLAVLGLPNFIRYQNNLELRSAAKDVRSFLWDAQGRSEAPENSDVLYYYSDLNKQTPPLATATTWVLKNSNLENVSSVTLPKNIYIKSIKLETSPGVFYDVTGAYDTRLQFNIASNRTLGIFSGSFLSPVPVNSIYSIVLILASSKTSSEYQVKMDQARYQITLVKSA